MASILGKTPFVDKILSSCSSEQLSSLQSLINNPGSATTVYLYGNDRLLSNSNKGVSYVQLMIDEYSRRYLNGFLVYIDSTHCGFFSFLGTSSHLIEIEINPLTLAYVDIYENLSAEEFRRTLGDMVTKGEGGNDSNIYEVSNINNISKDILDELKAGDVVVKITGNQKHTYVVSYKGEGAGEGICLTYVDAGRIETVSYDRSGSNWVYNSTDVVEVGAGGSGTQLYRHRLVCSNNDGRYFFDFVSLNSTNLSGITTNYSDMPISGRATDDDNFDGPMFSIGISDSGTTVSISLYNTFDQETQSKYLQNCTQFVDEVTPL